MYFTCLFPILFDCSNHIFKITLRSLNPSMLCFSPLKLGDSAKDVPLHRTMHIKGFGDNVGMYYDEVPGDGADHLVVHLSRPGEVSR